ncbi:SAM-dependent methyltransferase|nr:SAM-dependent methyltransferase [Candidatus Pantoea persica]
MVLQYLDFQYGPRYFGVANYAESLVALPHSLARHKDIGLGADLAQHIQFVQGDACNLKPQPAQYDLVLAANLIDWLRQPQRFLQDIAPMILSGGLLLLSSPYIWLEEFTPKENWLGGVRENGEALTTLQALQRLLVAEFEPIGAQQDLPFVICETARKYQHTLAQVTLWRKR